MGISVFGPSWGTRNGGRDCRLRAGGWASAAAFGSDVRRDRGMSWALPQWVPLPARAAPSPEP